MQDMKLKENWDIDRSGGDIQFISGSEETAQNVGIGLRTIRGEYIFDRQLGVPWLNGMMGANYLNVERDHEIRKSILGREGVKKINELFFRVDSAARVTLVQYSIETLYGTSMGIVDDSFPEEE